MMRYSIGDFSRITRLSVKTLRFYHEYGILKPAAIDNESEYRYYSDESIAAASIIVQLKALGFSLKEIRDVLASYTDDGQLVNYLQDKLSALAQRIHQDQETKKILEAALKAAKQDASQSTKSDSRIIMKEIPILLVAAIRFTGKYQDCGKKFGKLYKSLGRYADGASFSLYYDQEYREDDADIEACLPVNKTPVNRTTVCRAIEADDIQIRSLDGGTAATITHFGPYETIGASYKMLLNYINAQGMRILCPSREVYLKGPGLILPGNPEKYRTEIQLLIEAEK